ncbi:MAG: hypothetical protein PHR77_18960 [Kiritimatiellae bacterium]|nr:hypothetical protein [Kiritimatiellia bacterium]
MKSVFFRTTFLVILITAASTAAFSVNPYRASNLDVIPDSVEYAIVANHFTVEGTLDIKIDGKSYPSRYPPWFSILFLSPSFFIFGNDIGNAIYPITFWGIAGVLIAFLIGRLISGNFGGILSSLALIALPLYREHTKVIMTKIPCTALTLIACYLYLRLRTNHFSKTVILGLAGIIGALTVAIRPVSVGVLLSFLLGCYLSRQNINRFAKYILFLFPSVVILSLNLIFNNITFGAPFRNGYNFWCSVPFDYSSLCFSTNYL